MEETKSTRERKGFKVNLEYTNEFVDFWESLKERYPDKLFKVQGVHNDNFDISNFSKNFFRKSASVASVSVDANANVKEKSIAQYTQEYPKGLMRLNSFYQLFKWVKKIYGVKAAKTAVEKVLNGEIFVNDFSNYSTSYCYSFDLRMLLMEGMNFFQGGMKINAPKRSDSFVALLIQTTAFISNQIMGACSYPDCFVAWDWFLRNEHGEDYMKKVRAGEDSKTKKKILDQFQNLIYSFNFPFRSSQCVDTDTEVATPSGFKKYNELKVGDEIYTWKDGELNIQKVQAVNVKEYNGYMHRYSGRDISSPTFSSLYFLNPLGVATSVSVSTH